jgi:hypothetical protein
MKQWFETTIAYQKEVEDGKIKKVKESFLVDAINFGEAEVRIIKEASQLVSGDFEVDGVKKEGISEVFRNEEGGTWFKTKVCFVVLDEISGKEKRTKNIMYVQCMEIDDVIEKLTEDLKGTMADYVITSIVETKILDVFDYVVE